MLPSLLALPSRLCLYRPFHLYRPFIKKRALHDTTTAIPAFIGVHDNRGLPFFTMRQKNIIHAGFDTPIAADADVLVKLYRFI
jgi:hypothetical protein